MSRVIALLCFAGLLACDPPEPAPPPAQHEASEPAPDFTLEALAGEPVTLSALRGKPVLVDFWATWCAPCEATIPVLVAFRKKYAERVHVLGVSVDWDRDAVAPFAEQHRMNYPVLFGDESLALAYGAPGFPTLFVVDAEGRIADAHVGVMTLPELEASVAPLLGGDDAQAR
ncbi:MAG TPA: TlpA disulfide reductase family protein [Myxococcota bacterium]|nr:TlpA disulfide reductase family protein [Myxococcota bacterium]